MKKIILSLFLMLIPVALFAECNAPHTMCSIPANQCNSLQAGLVSGSNNWSCSPSAGGATACCFNTCITNATFDGTNCLCNANFYATGDTCTACAAGYTAPAGSNTQSDCEKNCSDEPISNGTKTADNPKVSEPNGCTHTITCNDGYHEESGACVGNSYTVKFNVGGGATSQPDKTGCTYGVACSWTNTTTRNNFSLNGWAATSGGVVITTTQLGATFTTPTPPAINNADIILYAVWKNCTNADGVDTWAAGDCQIENCKFGYQKSSNTCIACNTAGRYCANNAESACPKGWFCPTSGATGATTAYCKNSAGGAVGAMPTANYTGKCMCIQGSTSYAAAQNINGCYQRGKDATTDNCGSGNCTQFCQGTKCFHLPTSVPYKSKADFKTAYGGTCPTNTPIVPSSVCQ